MGMKGEEPDYQKQFDAAVRVIQGLPKNGAYRPSYEEMLRFYSYYKQATVGRCQIPRPGFWDPIGRYKWDAWNSLGKMTKMEAMAAYIAEMKKAAQKVINTVPLDESAKDMFGYFEPLYEVIDDMPRPPDSFFEKKTDSGSAPIRNGSLRKLAENSLPQHGECNETGLTDEETKSNHVPSDSESEVFCDSLEHVESDQVRRLSATQNFSPNNMQSVKSTEETGYKPPASSAREGKPNKGDIVLQATQQDVDLQVISAIQALQEDMKKVMERLGHLESQAALQGHTSVLTPCQPTSLHNGKELPAWSTQLSPRTWFFLLTWPFIIQWLHWYFQRQKR